MAASPITRHFLAIATAALASATSTAAAQQIPGLQIRAYDDLAAPGPWTNEVGPGTSWVALRYDERSDETTLVFVNTSIDTTVAGPVIARGLIAVYPFLASPGPGWRGNSSELNALTEPRNIEWENAGASLVVHPRRVARHLVRFLESNGPVTEFGTHNPDPETRDVVFGQQTWPELEPHDERAAWTAPVWWQNQPLPPTPIFHAGVLGYHSVFQAAYEYAVESSLNLDPESLFKLAEFLEQEIGFEVFVQSVHVKRPPTGPVRVRFGQTAVIRRRSLLQQNQDPWHAAMGATRWVPSVIDADQMVYLGGRGEFMYILFDGPVSGLRAWVPVPGTLMPVQQIPNPVVNGAVLRPEIAVFSCPSNTPGGLVYFDDGHNLIPPAHALSGAALLWPFDPLPGHLPPQ